MEMPSEELVTKLRFGAPWKSVTAGEPGFLEQDVATYEQTGYMAATLIEQLEDDMSKLREVTLNVVDGQKAEIDRLLGILCFVEQYLGVSINNTATQ